MNEESLFRKLSDELALPYKIIATVLALLDSGNTVPFIARYRKEMTGNLDEVQIRTIQERRAYLVEMEQRRAAIIASIDSQGKLTDALRAQIMACEAKNELEDLYLPYKPKRRTRAMIAREKGLEPLALKILEQSLEGDPLTEASLYVSQDKQVESVEEALQGARDIVAEMIAEHADIRQAVRHEFATNGFVVSKVIEGKDTQATKFEQYYAFSEKVSTIPSHRYLAIRRGEREGVLDFHIEIDPLVAEAFAEKIGKLNSRSPYASQFKMAITDACKRLLIPSVETDVRVDLKIRADRSAIDVFAANLRNLLLNAPLGGRPVIGIDPGMRTGCKCAAVDATGHFLETITFYLFGGERSLEQAKRDLLQFIAKYQPEAIGIGNGTGGRETEAFVKKILQEHSLQDLIVVQVNEAGASVYSASDAAREEFPDLDLTIRGAISIARRLQDPLAELVKIDPKAIGVGQYQHDVHQPLLHDKLSEVVESCVNHVGVELNTASASLLGYVAGIGPSLATKIVGHRTTHGPFKSRQELLAISGFGPRAFEQAAGFLRIRNAVNPLDSSAVHPERYGLVESIAKDLHVDLRELITNPPLIDKIDAKRYISSDVGELTLSDIFDELKKPGRDPRAVFERPCFREDVCTMSDLKVGMKLEGIVTNVTAFGAFVDIGVHQDALVHISELTDRFIKDPSEVVKTGDRIKVEVLSVDVARKRIALTAKSKSQVPVPRKQERKTFNSSPFAGLK
ncbi:MAG: Tex family protein [Parachlamydiaceae bacterium]